MINRTIQAALICLTLLFTTGALPITKGGNSSTPPPVLDSLQTLIAGMSPGSWKAIPNSKLRPVGYFEATSQPDYNSGIATGNFGSNGTSSIMSAAWGSAAFDTTRCAMWFMGGGHQNYFGNEAYKIDCATLTMQRVTTPGDSRTLAGYSSSTANTFANGDPVSGHQYSDLNYNSALDKIIGHITTTQTGSIGNVIFFLDPAVAGRNNPAGTWTNQFTISSVGGAEEWGWNDSAGNYWNYARPGARFVTKRTFSSGVWSNISISGLSGAFDHNTAVYIPTLNHTLMLGNGTYDVFDQTIPDFLTPPTPTGAMATTITNAIGPGLAYCPGQGTVVAFVGGSTLAIGNPSTHNWVAHTATNDPTNPVPVAIAGSGMFNRFQYVGTVAGKTYGAFLMFDDVDEFGYVYKPDFSC